MRISTALCGKAKPRAQAFTLAEVVVAVAVVGVSFVSLYMGMSGGFAITQSSRESLRSTQIMVERLEGLRLYNWSQLNTANVIPTRFTNYYYPNGLYSGTNRGIQYNGTMTVTNAALSPSASYTDHMRQITVTVWWTSGSRTRTNSMKTYTAEYGVQNYVFSN